MRFHLPIRDPLGTVFGTFALVSGLWFGWLMYQFGVQKESVDFLLMLSMFVVFVSSLSAQVIHYARRKAGKAFYLLGLSYCMVVVVYTIAIMSGSLDYQAHFSLLMMLLIILLGGGLLANAFNLPDHSALLKFLRWSNIGLVPIATLLSVLAHLGIAESTIPSLQFVIAGVMVGYGFLSTVVGTILIRNA